MYSITSTNRESIFSPSVYREVFGKCGRYSCQSLYAATSFCNTGKTLLGGGVMRTRIPLSHTFEDIISLENLLEAWKEFIKGKRKKRDVQEFSLHLMDNVLPLHRDLVSHRYEHGAYQEFHIADPKPRIIHKATVRDRLLHHAIYRKLYPFFDRTFIADSF